jgi:cell wall-associated NlpC family hydrolase
VANPRTIVTASLIGTGMVVVIANAQKGQAPKPRSVLGLGFIYVALSAMADFAPALAGPLAALVFTGTLLVEGGPALDAITGALGGHGQLGLGDSGATQARLGLPGGGTTTQTGRDLLAGAKAQSAVRWATRMIGTPYVYGGAAPGGFDCSGLCQWAYAHAGVGIPRVASDQQKTGQAVNASELLPGDLIFQGEPAHHVVMYIGNGQVVGAPHTGASVRTDGASYYLTTDPGGCRRIVAAKPRPTGGGGHLPK